MRPALSSYPHEGGCTCCSARHVCNACGVSYSQCCTNGRCASCHAVYCAPGGSTAPGHGYGPIPPHMHTLHIGDIGVAKDGRYIRDLLGEPRERMLRIAYNRRLPAEYDLWFIPWSGGWHRVTWEEVNWDSAGPRVVAPLKDDDLARELP